MNEESEINHESYDSVEEMQEAIAEENSEPEVEYTQDLGNGMLAVGFRVPTSVKAPSGYLDSLRSYEKVYNDIYTQMKVANKLYKYNSIVGNAIDVLTEFAISQIDILPTGSRRLDKILEFFFENVNMENTNGLPGVYPLLNEIVLEWFTSGNAFPYQKWANVTLDNARGQAILPISINLLNPQQIEVPEQPIAFGQEVIFLKPTSEIMQAVMADGRSNPQSALIKSMLPRSIINSIKAGGGTGFEKIRLNPKFVDHLKRKSRGYEAWGIPYLSRCFSEAALLERLRQMDESIATGLLNLVTIFKIGTEENPASPARMRKFAQLIRNPKATSTLVWAHDVEVIQVGPDGKLLQFDKKYKEAKENLMIGLGVPPVLSSLSASGDPWVSILALVERLQEWRKIITIWLERLCNRIAIENGFEDKKVKLRWHRMNLQDDAAIKNLLLAFYDRGLISIRDALEESGRNYEAVIAAKKTEKSQNLEKLFTPPEQPFQGSLTSQGRPPSSSPKMSKESTNKTQTKKVNTNNLKTETRKSPSSKVK